MSNDKIHSLVYSKAVVEFVTVANEFCELIETGYKFSVKETLFLFQRILPFLYYKAVSLPTNEKILEDEMEKYVTELEYNVLQQRWLRILGEHDSYY